MKRMLFTLIVGTMLATMLTAGSATASPPNKTSITLSCDRGTSAATVVVILEESVTATQSAGPVALTCGSSVSLTKSDRLVQTTGFTADYVVVDYFAITTPNGSVGCRAEGTLTLKFSCLDSSGIGATVVVR
jgi:hypothetical protein